MRNVIDSGELSIVYKGEPLGIIERSKEGVAYGHSGVEPW